MQPLWLSTWPRRALTFAFPEVFQSPFLAYQKLKGSGPSFLLESGGGWGHLGRYSFIGIEPSRIVTAWPRLVEVENRRQPGTICLRGPDVLDILRDMLDLGIEPGSRETPRFRWGAVGYLGFDSIGRNPCEPICAETPPTLPDAVFLLCDTVVILDHDARQLWITVQPEADVDDDAFRAQALAQAYDIRSRLIESVPAQELNASTRKCDVASFEGWGRQQFEAAVGQAKLHIAAGDIQKVVLSRRLTRHSEASPLAIYQMLRHLNVSPYMFFLDLPGNLQLIGASPEMMVRLEGRTAEMRPLAGTRPRATDAAHDDALAQELLSSRKDRHEHSMLVDMALEEMKQVCLPASVRVPTFMRIERHSQVMHLASHVVGEMISGHDAVDLVRACFPVGAVTGVPKTRATEIISRIESVPRGPYGGAVGYFDYSGSMEFCVTIRSIVMQNGVACLQAGCGITEDSDPSAEFEEAECKLRALEQAIAMAEAGADEPGIIVD
jgi:anthranilate synthase component 1